MRLIDADALPHSWQPDCNGSRWFVSGADVEAAPTICCADCAHFRRSGWTDDGHDLGVCYAGSKADCGALLARAANAHAIPRFDGRREPVMAAYETRLVERTEP